MTEQCYYSLVLPLHVPACAGNVLAQLLEEAARHGVSDGDSEDLVGGMEGKEGLGWQGAAHGVLLEVEAALRKHPEISAWYNGGGLP